ncbi:IPT/TIG domain-containing protein [Algoriphagus sp. NG3]|uniref:IPT/TIG domain-containing protein n=1 Tax=Algoriphagus sp. NG3 TaxID=3097546 RepID=UPI002A7F65B7|nr:IPT/TIG domain-containing protein [Algoriphagus sp. NG3]WPR75743.1 IPT/TIG domain-containing protein [Algoriphagus sp. NG3]
MKNSWIGLLICLVVVFACNENDEVVPRTSPRFSVTLVQEINSTGAEFLATVYDFGSDPIIEYGFVYSRGDEPRVFAGEVIKSSGQPEKSFRLVGDHSMMKGQTYYVAAFLRTDQAIIYSMAVPFVSQGSEGFIFKELMGGSEVYYGDTLTVIGEKFSTNLANYEVKVNGSVSEVIPIDDSKFKIIIPEQLGFGYTYDYDGKLVITIKILEKTLTVNSEIQFYDPVFYPSEREFRYEEDFYIKGEFLRDAEFRINLSDGASHYTLPIVSISDTLVVFKPDISFESLKPEFQIYIRGKFYQAKDIIRIQKTEINSGQNVKSGSIYSYINIKGSNFNSLRPNNNFFLSDVDGQQFYVQEASPNEIKIYVQTENLVPNPRFFKVWANNAGVKSTNFVTVENTEPILAYMGTHAFPFNAATEGRSVNWKNKGIWLLDGKITEVDPRSKTGRVLKNVDLKQGNIASSFAVIDQDVVYFSGLANTIANTPGKFYSYNLNTGILQEQPAVPSKASTPKSVFVSGGYLYYGGGYYLDEVDIQKVEESYKFNLSTRTWSSWNKKFPVSDYWDFETTFQYNGQIYGLVNEINDSDYIATRLMVFDKSSEDWVEVAKYPYLGYSNGNAAMPIGSSIYVLLGHTLRKINMSTYQQSAISGIYIYNRGYTGPPYLFLSHERIYYAAYNDYVLHEIDPTYIRE